MIHIDGSFGEGGGQILRTAMVLAALTGKELHLTNIRAKRRKPGLMRQHLACVKAVAEITGGSISGAKLNSQELSFSPGQVRAGDYHFVVGSAGSAILIAQCAILCLLDAEGPSTVVIEGGTHAANAPIFDFFERVYLPCLKLMGSELWATLDRAGFYPAGGGRITLGIRPQDIWQSFELHSRGDLRHARLVTVSHGVDAQIPRDELRYCRDALAFDLPFTDQIKTVDAHGPGNVLFAELEYTNITELFSVCGDFSLGRQTVGERVANMANNYLGLDAPVWSYLADQLLLPMAIGAGGSFRTCQPSQHSKTNSEVIKAFLDVDITMTEEKSGQYRIEVRT